MNSGVTAHVSLSLSVSSLDFSCQLPTAEAEFLAACLLSAFTYSRKTLADERRTSHDSPCSVWLCLSRRAHNFCSDGGFPLLLHKIHLNSPASALREIHCWPPSDGVEEQRRRGGEICIERRGNVLCCR